MNSARVLLLLAVILGASRVKAAERLLPLTPSLAELVSALGAEDEIVGVTEYTDYPLSLKSKPSVGPYPRLSLESIYRLKPTLALASKSGNQESQVEFLRKKGIRVEVFSEESFAELLENVIKIGALIGKTDQAKKLRADWQTKRDSLIEEAKKNPHSGCIAIQLSDRPLIVVGSDSYLDEVLQWLGRENCFKDLPSRYPQISDEALVKKDPDWILVFDSMGEDGAATVARWKKLKKVRAVKKNQVRVVRLDELLRPGPRLVVGARKLMEIIRN